MLCQVALDELAEQAPPDVLQEVMLSIVFPLARQVWATALRGDSPQDQKRRNPHDQPSQRRNLRVASTPPPPPPPRDGRVEDAATALQTEGARPEEDGDDQEEDGFEMVEAPDSGVHPPAALAAASAPPLHREPSGGGQGGAGGESEEGDGDGDNDGDEGGEAGSRLPSSQALLALLLVLKSFLKHLSSLRGGGRFVEVWRQVSEPARQIKQTRGGSRLLPLPGRTG